jgi:chromate transporter
VENAEPLAAAPPAASRASLLSIAVAFGRVSATAFGGGGMAAIRREVVRRNRWVDDDTFLEILSLAQLLPGSNPTNVAVLVGTRLRGAAGATVGLLACVLPGFAILMALGAVALDSHAGWVGGALRGCAAMAVGLTFANAIEMTAQRINLVDIAIVAAVALAVLVLHASLALTLAIFLPVALVLTRPPKGAS